MRMSRAASCLSELFVPTPCQKNGKINMLDIFSFSHQGFSVGHDIMFIFPGCRDLRQCEGRAPTGAAEGNVSFLTQEIVMWYIPNTTSWKPSGNDMERNTANKNARQHKGKKLGTPHSFAFDGGPTFRAQPSRPFTFLPSWDSPTRHPTHVCRSLITKCMPYTPHSTLVAVDLCLVVAYLVLANFHLVGGPLPRLEMLHAICQHRLILQTCTCHRHHLLQRG